MARGGFRPGAGRKKGAKTGKVSSEIKKDVVPADILAEAAAEQLDPLTYMLRVMNDPFVDDARRDRMAVSAAPFCHARKGEGVGKKEEKADRAKAAGAGRFASGAPPKLAVVK